MVMNARMYFFYLPFYIPHYSMDQSYNSTATKKSIKLKVTISMQSIHMNFMSFFDGSMLVNKQTKLY